MSYISSLQCWDEEQCIQVRLFKWLLRSHLLQTNPFVQTLPWRYAGQILSYCCEFTDTPYRSKKGALPPSQHGKHSAGGWHKWDYVETRNITWDVNKKHFQHTSLWNHYKRNAFGLLIPHILAIVSSWRPLPLTCEAQSYYFSEFQSVSQIFHGGSLSRPAIFNHTNCSIAAVFSSRSFLLSPWSTCLMIAEHTRGEKGGEIQQHSQKSRGISGNLHLEINKGRDAGEGKRKPQRL